MIISKSKPLRDDFEENISFGKIEETKHEEKDPVGSNVQDDTIQCKCKFFQITFNLYLGIQS